MIRSLDELVGALTLADSGWDHSDIPTIYTKSVCQLNGSPKAIGGFGCFSHRYPYFNHAGPLEGRVTQPRGELSAIQTALSKAIKGNYRQIEIVSCCENSIRSINEWLDTWKQNGWTKHGGKAVMNQDLFKSIERMRNQIDVTFSWFDKNDQSFEMNEAYRLAKQGLEISRASWEDAPQIFAVGKHRRNSPTALYSLYFGKHFDLPSECDFLECTCTVKLTAQLYAVKMAILRATQLNLKQVVVITSSEKVVYAVDHTLKAWKRDELTLPNRQLDEYLDILFEIERLKSLVQVRVRQVRNDEENYSLHQCHVVPYKPENRPMANCNANYYGRY